MAGILNTVYLAVVLAVGILLMFGIWWTGRDLDQESSTSDLLRAIAVTAFIVLMSIPLLGA